MIHRVSSILQSWRQLDLFALEISIFTMPLRSNYCLFNRILIYTLHISHWLTFTTLNSQPGISCTSLLVKIGSYHVPGRYRDFSAEQAGHDCTEILLPLPPKCWGERYVLPHTAELLIWSQTVKYPFDVSITYVWFVSAHICVSHVLLFPMEARKGDDISWSSSVRWLQCCHERTENQMGVLFMRSKCS